MQIRIFRASLLLFLVVLVSSAIAFSQKQQVNDPQAVALATQAIATLTQGVAVNDVTLAGSVTWTTGGDNQSGSAKLKALAGGDSRLDLTLGGAQKSEIRNNTGLPAGGWIGTDGISHRAAVHNCWTDAAWFFPALSSLAGVNDPSFLYTYVGQETKNDATVYHLQTARLWGKPGSAELGLFRQWSTTDFYLDAKSLLPIAIDFSVHPDDDSNTNISVDIRFADYRSVTGVVVPFHVQKFVNNGLVLDLTVNSVSINSGLTQNDFVLP